MIPLLTTTAASLLALAAPSQAWISQPPLSALHRRHTSTSLFSTIGKRDDSPNSRQQKQNTDYDLESMRADLESLMAESSFLEDDSTDEGSASVLTTAGRHRRQLEMDLLRQLYLDDDNNRDEDGESKAVDELMHLWIYEHDVESAQTLEAMQQSCSPGMVLEEQQLRRMRDEFPTWAEPRARLAILLFMKGISDEAYAMACEALELKPWHFEVYPILIMICLRHDDMGQALYWARRALPTFRPSPNNQRRRKAWIDRALAQAAEQWEQAERKTLAQQQKVLGTGEGAFDSDDSWQ